jgi:hypothetical protein
LPAIVPLQRLISYSRLADAPEGVGCVSFVSFVTLAALQPTFADRLARCWLELEFIR